MEREIKFRAWNTNNDQMYFNVESGIDLGLFIGFGDALIQTNLKVMQYTGLKDKNGKEIYESDIDKNLGVVKWLQATCEYVFENEDGFSCLTDSMTKDVEIIGNIYELAPKDKNQ